MTGPAWTLPVEVIQCHRKPVCHLRPCRRPDGLGGYRLVIEGNVMTYAGSRRQMIAVADWVSMNWVELRSLVLQGPDPEWLRLLTVEKRISGGQGDACEDSDF